MQKFKQNSRFRGPGNTTGKLYADKVVLVLNVKNVEEFMNQGIVLRMVKCVENERKSIIGQNAVKSNLLKKQQLQMNS